MSVAFVYNKDALRTHIADFIQYQINLVTDNIHATDSRIELLTQKLQHVEETAATSEKDKIEADYAPLIRMMKLEKHWMRTASSMNILPTIRNYAA